MSVYVIAAVLKHSQAKLANRLVMIVLADAASPDGVTWLGRKQIADAAKLAQTHVSVCTGELEEMGELEVRQVQLGRRRRNVYRILLPGVSEVDYDRIPFDVSTPFSTAPDDGVRNPNLVADGVRNPNGTGLEIDTPLSKDPPVGPVSGTSEQAPRSREQGKTRKQNIPFDALVEECPGTDPAVDGGRIARALSDIRKRARAEANGEVPVLLIAARDLAARAVRFEREMEGDPLENLALAAAIRQRAQLYRERWPDIDLTPTALAKNWTLVATPLPGGKVTASMIPVNEEEL